MRGMSDVKILNALAQYNLAESYETIREAWKDVGFGSTIKNNLELVMLEKHQ